MTRRRGALTRPRSVAGSPDRGQRPSAGRGRRRAGARRHAPSGDRHRRRGRLRATYDRLEHVRLPLEADRRAAAAAQAAARSRMWCWPAGSRVGRRLDDSSARASAAAASAARPRGPRQRRQRPAAARSSGPSRRRGIRVVGAHRDPAGPARPRTASMTRRQPDDAGPPRPRQPPCARRWQSARSISARRRLRSAAASWRSKASRAPTACSTGSRALRGHGRFAGKAARRAGQVRQAGPGIAGRLADHRAAHCRAVHAAGLAGIARRGGPARCPRLRADHVRAPMRSACSSSGSAARRRRMSERAAACGIAIVAGEESGDLLGADLVRALSGGQRPRASTWSASAAAICRRVGLEHAFDAAEIALMGVSARRPRPAAPACGGSARRPGRSSAAKPDCLVTIDSPGFQPARRQEGARRRPGDPDRPLCLPECLGVAAERASAMKPYVDQSSASCRSRRRS